MFCFSQILNCTLTAKDPQQQQVWEATVWEASSPATDFGSRHPLTRWEATVWEATVLQPPILDLATHSPALEKLNRTLHLKMFKEKQRKAYFCLQL